ncbi:HNH endonuclease [Parabacteroides goldsteinii]|uniref:HNH endonuclease n=1 Tax=Parabacteroides goldsteinii TaxID=328812 RepID=UPI001D4530C8|nr:HNH endonuclease [Parabacteroides goldsteinii]MBS6574788.1 HNH endonuclease [Parabacteroides goldsteinii]
MRDKLGRFTKGHIELAAEKIRRLEASRKGWIKSNKYIHNLIEKEPYIYNSWRGFMFTAKGMKYGVCNEWRNFRYFFEDMYPSYKKGFRLTRLDRLQPFSKENCIWVEDHNRIIFLDNSVRIRYEEEELTIKEWASKLGKSATEIKTRYYRHKNDYTTEEILFGKRTIEAKTIKDISELTSKQKLKDKASKMISSYKLRDFKRKRDFNISQDWFIENILKSKCIYCGDTMKLGCDRIDNTKGHTMDNVVPCCYSCNVARFDNFTFEEMKIIGETIKKVKQNRNNTRWQETN